MKHEGDSILFTDQIGAWPSLLITLIGMTRALGCFPFVSLLMWSLACFYVLDGAKDGVKRSSGGFFADYAGTDCLQRHPRGGAAAAARGDYYA